MDIIYKDGEDVEDRFTISSPFIVGRGAQCDLTVQDQRASREHFKIISSLEGYKLVDISSNGTRVNGRLVEEIGLKEGDQIEIASSAHFEVVASMSIDMEEDGFEDEENSSDSGIETLSLDSPVLRPKLSITDIEKHLDLNMAYMQALQLCHEPRDFLHAIGSYLDSQINIDRLMLCLVKGETFERHDREGKGILKRWAQLPMSSTVLEQSRDLKQAVLARNIMGELSDSHSADIASISSVMAVPLFSGAMPDKEECFAVLYADRVGDSPSFELNDLKMLTQTALSLGRALEAWILHRRLGRNKKSKDLIGSSKAMVTLRQQITRAAATESPIMILGSSGCGKGFVAEKIHEESLRSHEAFVRVDCASLVESLAASELFGHLKGSFTGADNDREGALQRANGGSILFDHIDELDLEVQAMLLRALEAKRVRPVGGTDEIEVDVRLLSSASENLEQKVRDGAFRQDLLFRLKVIDFEIPDLNQRPEDVPELAAHFLEEMSSAAGKPLMRWEKGFMEALSLQEWPGNLRELKNQCERLMIMSSDAVLRVKDLEIKGEEESMLLEDIIHEHIRRVMTQCKGNKSQTAEVLGIDRSTLYARLKQMEN